MGGHRFDMHDLESLVFEFVNGAREDIVGFALEFGRGASRALFGRERGGIQAIGVGLTGRRLPIASCTLEANAAVDWGWSWNQRVGVTSTKITMRITARS